MTKLSGYKKLKAQNLKLWQDIHTILLGDIENKTITTQQYLNIFKLEDMIWGGKKKYKDNGTR